MISSFIRIYQKTERGSQWFDKLDQLSQNNNQQLTLSDLAINQLLSLSGKNQDIPESMRILIVFDDDLSDTEADERVSQPLRVETGESDRFTVLKVHPASFEKDINGLSLSTELLVRLEEAASLQEIKQESTWENEVLAEQEELIREELGLPELYDDSGEIEIDEHPLRLGFELELKSFAVKRKNYEADQSLVKYRGVALIAAGEEAGQPNLKVTLDHSRKHGATIELVFAPFNTDSYTKDF